MRNLLLAQEAMGGKEMQYEEPASNGTQRDTMGRSGNGSRREVKLQECRKQPEATRGIERHKAAMKRHVPTHTHNILQKVAYNHWEGSPWEVQSYTTGEYKVPDVSAYRPCVLKRGARLWRPPITWFCQFQLIWLVEGPYASLQGNMAASHRFRSKGKLKDRYSSNFFP